MAAPNPSTQEPLKVCSCPLNIHVSLCTTHICNHPNQAFPHFEPSKITELRAKKHKPEEFVNALPNGVCAINLDIAPPPATARDGHLYIVIDYRRPKPTKWDFKDLSQQLRAELERYVYTYYQPTKTPAVSSLYITALHSPSEIADRDRYGNKREWFMHRTIVEVTEEAAFTLLNDLRAGLINSHGTKVIDYEAGCNNGPRLVQKREPPSCNCPDPAHTLSANEAAAAEPLPSATEGIAMSTSSAPPNGLTTGTASSSAQAGVVQTQPESSQDAARVGTPRPRPAPPPPGIPSTPAPSAPPSTPSAMPTTPSITSAPPNLSSSSGGASHPFPIPADLTVGQRELAKLWMRQARLPAGAVVDEEWVRDVLVGKSRAPIAASWSTTEAPAASGPPNAPSYSGPAPLPSQTPIAVRPKVAPGLPSPNTPGYPFSSFNPPPVESCTSQPGPSTAFPAPSPSSSSAQPTILSSPDGPFAGVSYAEYWKMSPSRRMRLHHIHSSLKKYTPKKPELLSRTPLKRKETAGYGCGENVGFPENSDNQPQRNASSSTAHDGWMQRHGITLPGMPSSSNVFNSGYPTFGDPSSPPAMEAQGPAGMSLSAGSSRDNIKPDMWAYRNAAAPSSGDVTDASFSSSRSLATRTPLSMGPSNPHVTQAARPDMRDLEHELIARAGSITFDDVEPDTNVQYTSPVVPLAALRRSTTPLLLCGDEPAAELLVSNSSSNDSPLPPPPFVWDQEELDRTSSLRDNGKRGAPFAEEGASNGKKRRVDPAPFGVQEAIRPKHPGFRPKEGDELIDLTGDD